MFRKCIVYVGQGSTTRASQHARFALNYDPVVQYVCLRCTFQSLMFQAPTHELKYGHMLELFKSEGVMFVRRPYTGCIKEDARFKERCVNGAAVMCTVCLL
jgi:hypothetical protein